MVLDTSRLGAYAYAMATRDGKNIKTNDPLVVRNRTRDDYSGIEIGNRVRRVQGRPENVGRQGTVVAMSDYAMFGEVRITVREQDGSEFSCFPRQVRKV